MVFAQESPIRRAVVSQELLSFSREFFIIRYGVEKKCTTLHRIISAKVFCSGVPVKISRNAIPITMPGIVLVTRAMLSMMPFHLLPSWLLAVARAAP